MGVGSQSPTPAAWAFGSALTKALAQAKWEAEALKLTSLIQVATLRCPDLLVPGQSGQRLPAAPLVPCLACWAGADAVERWSHASTFRLLQKSTSHLATSTAWPISKRTEFVIL
jgi:hypothetical protein